MRSRAVLLVTVMTVALLMVASPAWAGDFTVNSMADVHDESPGNGTCGTRFVEIGVVPECTLRAAIEEVNANALGDTISFDPALSGTITLILGQLVIDNDTPTTDLSINGPGASKISVSGNNASRVFSINSGAKATISGLTIKNGKANGSTGGGIYNTGTLELTNTTVSGNQADFFGGGIDTA